ncbi:MAG TPA: beta-ketoacyl synthase [Spongiibacteraceae bacterium]|nr:beta-ketoacyl synthase [Spongiibacteraceae bacterium]
MMAKLPLIVGFGGINAAGRSSFHHGYRRMVIDALDQSTADLTLRSLAGVMGLPLDGALSPDQQHYILEHTLIRRIENDWFDPDRVPLNRRMPMEAGQQPLSFVTKARNLPELLPAGWQVSDLGDRTVRVDISGDTEFLLPCTEVLSVQAAGILPTGFDPSKLYQSRNHPRGLQLSVFAASDALGSLGIDWETIRQHVAPDQISCYAGNAMSQCDENGNGGMLGARYRGKRVTSKQLPFGLLDMPADFVNAYVLGNIGNTGGNAGACATFLYSLRQGLDDIHTGRARVVVVGSSEAPVTPDVMEGFAAMGALAQDKDLLALDAHLGRTTPNYRRAARPFSTNCGFTIAEGAQYIVLMDDELALQLGATIYGAVSDVFVNADGHKKSISGPGAGNYVTVAKACGVARAIVGEESLRRRSMVQAHGTSTPQNRVSESHILNQTAKLFGIENWPVAAIKAYIGHTLGPSSGDQLAATLGVWAHGFIPGIKTIDHIAADVHQSNLRISSEHLEVGTEGIDVAILNSKGFGGNNASAPLLAPHIAQRLLQKHHGEKALSAYRKRNEAVREQAAAYDAAACTGDFRTIYKFDHNVLNGEQLDCSAHAIAVPGFGRPIDLDFESRYKDW